MKYDEIEHQMSDPDVMSDMKRSYSKLSKDYKSVQKIVEDYEVQKCISQYRSCKRHHLDEKDEEFRSMAKEELNAITQKRDQLEEDIRLMLEPAVPKTRKMH